MTDQQQEQQEQQEREDRERESKIEWPLRSGAIGLVRGGPAMTPHERLVAAYEQTTPEG
jgi:hypothetical protein